MCTSTAFWLPSGCVIPVEPTNMPGLMSAIDDFTIATNSGLSVTVNLTSAPSPARRGRQGRSRRPRAYVVTFWAWLSSLDFYGDGLDLLSWIFDDDAEG